MRKRYSKRVSVALILITGFIGFSRSQPLNYQVVFGNDWQKAKVFVMENEKWIKPMLDKYHISYPLAIAVVFPELVRYSSLRDKMEIALLKALYISLGDEYANFSIGQFQMKPSFAEMVREEATVIIGIKSEDIFKDRSEYADIRLFRTSIVTDLEDPKAQLNYLIAFFKICESNFHIRWQDEKDKLSFLATAYNYGFNKSAEQIRSMTDKKFFNTGLFKTENYSYSDISLFWYNQFLKDSLTVRSGNR